MSTAVRITTVFWTDNYGVLDRIMKLQEHFDSNKIVALLGNHDEMVLNGEATIHNNSVYAHAEECEDDSDEDKYIDWFSLCPSAILCRGEHDFRV